MSDKNKPGDGNVNRRKYVKGMALGGMSVAGFGGMTASVGAHGGESDGKKRSRKKRKCRDLDVLYAYKDGKWKARSRGKEDNILVKGNQKRVLIAAEKPFAVTYATESKDGHYDERDWKKDHRCDEHDRDEDHHHDDGWKRNEKCRRDDKRKKDKKDHDRHHDDEKDWKKKDRCDEKDGKKYHHDDKKDWKKKDHWDDKDWDKDHHRDDDWEGKRKRHCDDKRRKDKKDHDRHHDDEKDWKKKDRCDEDEKKRYYHDHDDHDSSKHDDESDSRGHDCTVRGTLTATKSEKYGKWYVILPKRYYYRYLKKMARDGNENGNYRDTQSDDSKEDGDEKHHYKPKRKICWFHVHCPKEDYSYS